jgi:hypothetical protein
MANEPQPWQLVPEGGGASPVPMAAASEDAMEEAPGGPGEAAPPEPAGEAKAGPPDPAAAAGSTGDVRGVDPAPPPDGGPEVVFYPRPGFQKVSVEWAPPREWHHTCCWVAPNSTWAQVKWELQRTIGLHHTRFRFYSKQTARACPYDVRVADTAGTSPHGLTVTAAPSV